MNIVIKYLKERLEMAYVIEACFPSNKAAKEVEELEKMVAVVDLLDL